MRSRSFSTRMRNVRGWVPLVAVATAVTVTVLGVVWGITLDPRSPTVNPPPPRPPATPPPGPSPCPRSVGLCIEANVSQVVDGETLDLEGGRQVRLVLVDAPELGADGGPAARDYLAMLCLAQSALIDEDDNQIGQDPFGRVLAVVHCAGSNANAALISSGHAVTYQAFCSVSEFASETWTGCSSPPYPECDAAYPDVCIPPPPPDLNCPDVPYRNFRVLAPDPHYFDGDGDGLGCEGP